MQLKYKDASGNQYSVKAKRITEHFCIHKTFGFPAYLKIQEPAQACYCFAVSHIATGRRIGEPFKLKESAELFAKELERIWPDRAKDCKDPMAVKKILGIKRRALTQEARTKALKLYDE